MSQVWDLQTESLTQKLVLLALADNANDQGFCWPSISHLATKCQMSEQGVRNQIKLITALGWISLKPRYDESGDRTSNLYQLHIPSEGGQRGAGGGQPGAGGVVNRVHPEPLVEPSLHIHKEKRLHGIPANAEEVIAFGQTLYPPKDEQTCRDFFSHYEGQKRTGPSGDIFWITSADTVVTSWKDKLPSFRPQRESKRPGYDRNANTANARTVGDYDGIGKVK